MIQTSKMTMMDSMNGFICLSGKAADYVIVKLFDAIMSHQARCQYDGVNEQLYLCACLKRSADAGSGGF